MLEKEEIRDEITLLLKNFDNLNRAHESVERAREQLKTLEPLVNSSDEYGRLIQKIEDNKRYSDGLLLYFNKIRLELYKKKTNELTANYGVFTNKLQESRELIERLDNDKTSLIKAIANDKDSKRLMEIDYQIKVCSEKKQDRLRKYDNYKAIIKALELQSECSEELFYRNILNIESLRSELSIKITEVNEGIIQTGIVIRDLNERLYNDEDELKHLMSRNSQIPLENSKIRKIIADGTGVNEIEIPFVAELVKVKEGFEDWEPAIERLLRSFGLSMLVPEKLYDRINDFINKTDLKSRVVFYRIEDSKSPKIQIDGNKMSVINRLAIKEDTPFYNWIYNEINSRFGFACCESADEFNKYPFAVTKSGLIKTAGVRHEKDDRRSYILGWDNRKKISTYEERISRCREEILVQKDKLNLSNQYKSACEEKERNLFFLKSFDSFDEINWELYAKELEVHKVEKKKIEDSSDKLKTLHEQLENNLDESHITDIVKILAVNIADICYISEIKEKIFSVLKYFKSNPMPQLYIRELPIEVDTKFIERNMNLVKEFLDIISDSTLTNERVFEKRYGLKFNEPLIRLNILDNEIALKYFSGISDISIKVSDFNKLKLPVKRIIILENKTSYTNIYNFLTMPQIENTLAIFGKGFGVGLIRDAEWFRDKRIIYWGDIDPHGFMILSGLRGNFPQMESIMMDRVTCERHYEFVTDGEVVKAAQPENLTSDELDLFEKLNSYPQKNRLEQELIPVQFVRAVFENIFK